MSRVKKVGFLMEFNKPRVIGPIRIDTIGIGLATLLIVYTALTLASTKTWLAILITFVATWYAIKLYKKAREKSSRGYLWHLGYDSGIWSIRQDPKKYKELKRMDIRNYLPDSTMRNFKD